jgi:hypothetical protein
VNEETACETPPTDVAKAGVVNQKTERNSASSASCGTYT